MKVYCNPYCHLDHKGRLAGACPMEPTHRAGERSYVCADMAMAGKVVRKNDPRGDREDYVFAFTAEPMSIDADPGWYYMQRARSGEVFAPRDGKPPMDAWLKARAEAVAAWTAQAGSPPDFAAWAEQFPFDADIAKAASPVKAKSQTVAGDK
jgi:hypothetical protein